MFKNPKAKDSNGFCKNRGKPLHPVVPSQPLTWVLKTTTFIWEKKPQGKKKKNQNSPPPRKKKKKKKLSFLKVLQCQTSCHGVSVNTAMVMSTLGRTFLQKYLLDTWPPWGKKVEIISSYASTWTKSQTKGEWVQSSNLINRKKRPMYFLNTLQ